MRSSETLTKIAPALVAALSKIDGVAKTKSNPGFKGSKYADLESVIDASKDILTENGLAVLQFPGALVNGVLTLETILLHTSGEFISGECGIALGKADPQGVGSAITYARRYAQMAALNMPAVDDDAETAMGRGKAQAGEPFSAACIEAERLLRSKPDPADFRTFWETNKDGWKEHLTAREYAHLVGVMKEVAATFKPKDAAA